MEKMSKGVLMTALITGMCLSGVQMAFADEYDDSDASSEFTLDTMVVTAQRMETKELDTPNAVTVVTEKDIEKSGATNAYDVIERQVGFTNNAYGTGGREFGGSSSRTVLRGLDKGTLVMVNGAPINMMNYNSMEGIPIEAIEKIEIVRGAQSVLYGAEATGGVINIITKKGGAPKTTLTVGAGNYDKKYGITTIGEKYVASFTKDYFGDVDRTNAIYSKSTRDWQLRDSRKDNIFLSVSPLDNLSVNWAHTKGTYYRDSWTVSDYKKTGAGTAYIYEDTRDNVSMNYDDTKHQFKSIVAYNKRSVAPYQATISGYRIGKFKRASSSDWDLNTLTWDTQKVWNPRHDRDAFVVGFTIQRESSEDRTKHDEGVRKDYGIYASYKYAVSDRFDITAGVRGQRINENYLRSDPDGHKKDHNELVPQFQMLYKINQTTSWYANVAKSYQLPPLNEFFSYTEYRVSALKPQEGWTYETGLKHITNTSSLKFDVYHMNIDGKFEWRKDEATNVNYLVNAGTFLNTGVELEYTKLLGDKWSYDLGAAISNPKTKEEGTDDYVQSDARVQLTMGVNYKIGKLSSNLNYLYIGKRENSYYNYLGQSSSTYGADHRVPHRSLLNAVFTYRADEHHSLALNLNNIFDNHDVINKYENWSLPFNWMLTYNFSF